MAGTGKTTIARTIAARYFYDNNRRFGASFFFSKNEGKTRNAHKLFTTISAQLAKKSSVLRRFINEALSKDPDIAHHTFHDQWNQLILLPLQRIDAASLDFPLIIIVDAVDECEDENDIRATLQLFAEARALAKGRLRIFVSSRREFNIRRFFDRIPEDHYEAFGLQSISSPEADKDISRFFRHKLTTIKEEYDLAKSWPTDLDITSLVERAGGLFQWAATACGYIDEGRQFAEIRLSFLLETTASKTGPEEGMDEIYTAILLASGTRNYTIQERDKLLKQFRTYVGSIVVLFEPFSAPALASLLGKESGQIYETLTDLHSILEVSKSQETPIRVLHPSFNDFLLDKKRCRDERLWVDVHETNRAIFLQCLEVMAPLKMDICNLELPGMRAADVEEKILNERLPPEVQYACRYWTEHLQRGKRCLGDDGLIYSFLEKHTLHWFEALSLMNQVSDGIAMLTTLQSLISVSKSCTSI